MDNKSDYLHLVLKTQKEILELQGYKVAYICIYGSQNYGLDINNEDYHSDIDMKAIIVPTLDDLITNSKPVSIVVDTDWGQCDVKDIRTFFETLLKANPAYIETLFTPYYVIDDNFENEFYEILSLRDDLIYSLRAQFLRAMYGMMCEKEKALCHPYPSIIKDIEKFGYSGKQAHHIKRLWIMMFDYFVDNKPLSECFYPPKESVELLLDLKQSKFDLEVVKDYVSKTMGYAKEFKDNILSQIDEKTADYSIKNTFINLSNKIIKDKIVREIKQQ